MGCGDRSVTFHKQHCKSNPTTIASGKLVQDQIPKPRPKMTKERQRLINCQMWIASPQTQILLKVSLSCTFLKTVKLSSKWLEKGRSPTMRHVSRTHRVAQVRLFDRIGLDPEIQIKYVDTKNQLADKLVKGSFTRDEWEHLFRLLSIINFSMFSCSHFLSNKKQSVMSKRAQESTAKEGSAVAKPRPMSLVPRNLLSAKKDPPQDSVIQTARRIKNWIRVVFHPAAGDWRETSTKTQQSILKRGNKMTLNLPVPGNRSGEMNLQA